MFIVQDIINTINDGFRILLVSSVNSFLLILHEIFKFSLILFLIYVMTLEVFNFWDMVLGGTLPSPSQLFTQSQFSITNDSINQTIYGVYLPKPSMNQNISRGDVDLDHFIKAELRNSDMSLNIKPRSSHFGQVVNASPEEHDKIYEEASSNENFKNEN
ncbi:uncharacterized protein LOC142219527 [Haematobia irritans]|uniref:uncharacterized protein LOC142219527 n=1 Tax=Haematobia irritans TaxID=7368 RepID=UPI003F4FDF10